MITILHNFLSGVKSIVVVLVFIAAFIGATTILWLINPILCISGVIYIMYLTRKETEEFMQVGEVDAKRA